MELEKQRKSDEDTYWYIIEAQKKEEEDRLKRSKDQNKWIRKGLKAPKQTQANEQRTLKAEKEKRRTGQTENNRERKDQLENSLQTTVDSADKRNGYTIKT